MKRCALIISDSRQFSDWFGCHITASWPNMLVEHARVRNAPMVLDRIGLSRYQLIIARVDFNSVAALDTCIFLLRILALDDHPEIIVISSDARGLEAARTTNLAGATCLLEQDLNARAVRSVLENIRSRSCTAAGDQDDFEIPGYTIKSSIAGTYTATIYRAYSEQQQRDVALKVCDVDAQYASIDQPLSLLREYEALRKLAGPYIAEAYEYGEHRTIAYMALEYFQSGSLGEMFRSSGRGKSRIEYMLEVARALQHVHQNGFLHLDLKPNNIMVRLDGSIALIDFGIATRMFPAQQAMSVCYSLGSPFFMSPEQQRGEPLDVRSDIYSFGAVFYRILTGRVPYAGKRLDEILMNRSNAGIPDLGPALQRYQEIIDKTLVADQSRRFQSVEELIASIEHHLGEATGIHRCLTIDAGMQEAVA
jgi:hypothetical protein